VAVVINCVWDQETKDQQHKCRDILRQNFNFDCLGSITRLPINSTNFSNSKTVQTTPTQQ